MLVLAGCAGPDRPPAVHGAASWAPIAEVVNAGVFAVDLDRELALAVVCTLPGAPDERHELASPAAASHELPIYGLLAGRTYDCALSAGSWSESLAVAVPELPDWLPTWSVVAEPGAGGDYTLFSHGSDEATNRLPSLVIVDRDGEVRWAYASPFADATDLDAQYLGDGQFLYGGGYSARPTIVDLAGTVVAQAGESSSGGPYNHHVEQAETGTYTIATAGNTDGTDGWTGFVVDALDPSLGERTWTWESQRGVDEGWLPAGTDDAYHANALIVDGDDLWVALRQLSWLAVVDRATGDHRFTVGYGQDFELVDANGDPADPADWFVKPHAPEKTGDLLLFYDNGDAFRRSSRVSEFRIDEAARTLERVWSWTEPGWYEPIWGDVDRLDGDRVLVVRAHCEFCDPGGDQRMQILEVDRATDAVVWRLTVDNAHSAGYRAARIDGCALFANRRFCSR